MKRSVIYRLEAPKTPGAVRILSRLHVSLDEGKTVSVVTLTRTGDFFDPRYGNFSITRDMLLQMVANFEANAYGQQIFIDVAHRPGDGAAGRIRRLMVEGSRLRAEVEWTPYGVAAITERGFTYLSAEFNPEFKDNEHGREFGPVLLGAGLTVRPVIKHLDPVQLSEDFTGKTPTYLHAELSEQLNTEAQATMKKYLEKLKKLLSENLKLPEAVVLALAEAFQHAAAKLGDDEQRLGVLLSEYEARGQQIVDAMRSSGAVTVQLDGGLTEADVGRLLSEAMAKQQRDQAAAQQTAEQRRKLLSDTINAAESLPEDIRRQLCESAAGLLHAGITEDQVRVLAQNQIALGQQLANARELSSMGFSMGGTARHVFSGGESQHALELQAFVNERLGRTSLGRRGKLKLTEEKKLDPFAQEVMGQFDAINADRILAEHNVMLANGQTGIGDTALPISVQRTVLRESLSDFGLLAVMQTLSDPGATTTTDIPYEQRDVGQVLNNGIVFEGQPIPSAGIKQMNDTAYVTPMKLAMDLTNEVVHFSRVSAIAWDAWARNIESNARYTRELMGRRLGNEAVHSADMFMAVAVSGESITAQLDGSTHTIKTANWPLIRPKQVRDIKGNAIGAVAAPIVLVVNGTAVNEYDGTNEQAAGIYYRITNCNLGYIQLVSELGVPVTPTGADAGADTIGYSYTGNVVHFDLDVPGTTTKERHLNGLLQAIGDRKALLAQERYEVPDFLAMSYTLNATATNAENYEANSARADMGLAGDGSMGPIKGLAPYAFNGLSDIGEERILIAQSGIQTYTVCKPWQMGTPFEAVNSQGKPLGRKIAYGEEYNAVHIPAPLRGRMTSVLAYSFTGR